jgi:enoyl-[acyl-carrier protein] reductase / trans-2-enoyl-CoA reductase (NAD+)
MIIKPVSRGFICTTAHPEGCAKHVGEQIAYVKGKPALSGAKKVLVIGASTGYGLASRITAAWAMKADTLGVFFERPADDKRPASAGWYNTAAFEREAKQLGTRHASLNGDAFSDIIKGQTINAIKKELGGSVDLVVYSLASPRRSHPKSGQVFSSVLKPLGAPYHNKTVNFQNGQVSTVSIDPANDQEVADTVAVMGGEDWEMWIDALSAAGVLAKGAKTVAYSYIGPDVTMAVYRDGTIGRAKDHLEKTAHALDAKLKKSLGGSAVVSVNKALVTQASAAIPVVPLYISLLYKVMKPKGLHEGCIEQMHRLFNEHLYAAAPKGRDAAGRIRIDDWEMRDDVQAEVKKLWDAVSTENIGAISDIKTYREDFFKLFGFGYPGLDYERDVVAQVPIPSIEPLQTAGV